MSHDDPIKYLGIRTAEKLLILFKCQCDEEGCQHDHLATNSVTLLISPDALTCLISILCASRCPKTCTGMDLYFLIVQWASLFKEGWWQSFISGHFCIFAEIFQGFPASWRALRATPPLEACRTMVLEDEIKSGNSSMLFYRVSEVTGKLAGCWKEIRTVSKYLSFSYEGFLPPPISDCPRQELVEGNTLITLWPIRSPVMLLRVRQLCKTPPPNSKHCD